MKKLPLKATDIPPIKGSQNDRRIDLFVSPSPHLDPVVPVAFTVFMFQVGGDCLGAVSDAPSSTTQIFTATPALAAIGRAAEFNLLQDVTPKQAGRHSNMPRPIWLEPFPGRIGCYRTERRRMHQSV
jgi:hypothetical protein